MGKDSLEWPIEIEDLSNIDPTILKKFPPYKPGKKTPSNFCDYTGAKINRLKVLYRGENYNGWHVSWICQCDCDRHTIIRVKADNLRSGNTNSCGCYNADRIKEVCKKYNRYDLSGEYGVGYCYNQDIEFYFDLEDYDKIKDYCWYYSKRGYIESRINGKLIKIHRLIMDVDDPNIEVDHKFHDKSGKPRTYDNRKINLRLCPHQKNSCNSKVYVNNTSGTTGVRFNSKRQVWQARITYLGKDYYLGSFKNKEDAIRARKKKEIELFNEYQYKEYGDECSA